MYVTNRQHYGHLVELDHYETDHYVNDMFDMFNNPMVSMTTCYGTTLSVGGG